MTAENLAELDIVAHHEAAHAVLAIELGMGVLDVGIDLERVAVTGGIGTVGCRLFVADLTDIAPSDVESEQRKLSGQIDCSGAVLAGGAASDAKLRGEDPWTALQKQQGDLTHMRDLLQRAKLTPTPEAEDERLREQLALAVEALGDPVVWRAIEVLAGAALERVQLSGDEIKAIADPILEPRRAAED